MKLDLSQAQAQFDEKAEYLRQVDGGKYAAIIESIYGLNKTQQLQAKTYHVAKKVGAVDSFNNLFKSDDVISINNATKISTLTGGKLEADKLFMCTHIQLQFGNATNLNETKWDRLRNAIMDGVFELKQDDRPIVEQTSCRIFDNAEHHSKTITGETNAVAGTPNTNTIESESVGAGLFKLPVTKFFYPQKAISAMLEFASVLSANDNIKMTLYGVQNCNI